MGVVENRSKGGLSYLPRSSGKERLWHIHRESRLIRKMGDTTEMTVEEGVSSGKNPV